MYTASDFANDLKLIKALLLHENNCSRTALVYKQKIADEWDTLWPSLHRSCQRLYCSRQHYIIRIQPR